MVRVWGWLLVWMLGAASAAWGQAATAPALPPEVREAALHLQDAAARDAALDVLAQKGDARVVPLLEAYRAGTLERRDATLVIYQSRIDVPSKGKVFPLIDAFTQQPLTNPDGTPQYAEKLGSAMISAPRAQRSTIAGIVATLSLLDPDPAKRKDAIVQAGDRADDKLLDSLQAQLQRDPKGPFAGTLRESIARIQLAHGTAEEKQKAAEHFAASPSSRADSALRKALETAQAEKNPSLAAACTTALDAIARHERMVNIVHHSFAGLSRGSILVLLALGLSIIFGLMGVINMAHGEFMMVGAFTTLVVCNFFKSHFPGSFDAYIWVAIPLAFLVSGALGYLVEVLVIRHLYGRPLETLLATWGVSLMLIQIARVLFGDTNAITPPHWLTGGWAISDDLVLPANRLFIIGYCIVCILLVYGLVNFTKLGLLLRATTQDRAMAGCLGVPTRRIDGLTFALGTGLAGLAGVAVVLYDKLNPPMGQSYVVDSFMVVVVGGVGKLAGAIWAGLGLGFLSKYLEPWFGAVYGQIAVLAMIVIFLQKRPSGLFPAKGRMADA